MTLAILVVLALIAIAALIYAVSIFNGLVQVRNNIDRAWANIDVLLKQRHDQIPKLVKVCEGYMAHERGVIDQVLKARALLMNASGPAQVSRAEGSMQGALRQLFAIAERYPDLKAQAGFQQLQARISSLESDIADRREFYNDSVNIYNIRIASFPDLFFARMQGLMPHELFKVSAADREDVKIEFGATTQ